MHGEVISALAPTCYMLVLQCHSGGAAVVALYEIALPNEAEIGAKFARSRSTSPRMARNYCCADNMHSWQLYGATR